MIDGDKKQRNHILFVCCGNRERSVIAENLFRRKIEEVCPQLTTRVVVASAGIFPREYLKHALENGLKFTYPLFGKNPNVYALTYLARKGIDISSYRSRGLNKEMAGEADLILAIDRLIKREILFFYPETAGKIFTCREFVFGADCLNLDIGDPMKLPTLDETTGAWVWPEDYPDTYIAEIQECIFQGFDKLMSCIKTVGQ